MEGILHSTAFGAWNGIQSARLARWARQAKIPKSDVIRALIDRAGPIETGDDLAEWVRVSEGKGLGLAQKP